MEAAENRMINYENEAGQVTLVHDKTTLHNRQMYKQKCTQNNKQLMHTWAQISRSAHAQKNPHK